MAHTIFISVFPCVFMLFEVVLTSLHVTVHQEVAGSR